MQQARYLTLLFNLAVFYFFQEDFSESKYWVQTIRDVEKPTQRKDIVHFAQVLEVVLHFELGNQKAVESFFRSIYRKLQSRNRLHPFERKLLNGIRRMSGEQTRKKETIFKALGQDLIMLNPQDTTGFREIQLYIQARITGKNLKVVYLESLHRQVENES